MINDGKVLNCMSKKNIDYTYSIRFIIDVNVNSLLRHMCYCGVLNPTGEGAIFMIFIFVSALTT